MWASMPEPGGRNDDSAPARRSAQSLGRNALPSRVMPWILNRRGVAAGMESAALAVTPPGAARMRDGTAACGTAPVKATIVP